MTRLKPSSLKPGARIGICAPSSAIVPDRFERGCDGLRACGYVPHIHPQTYEQWGQIAGNAEKRAAALMETLLDDTLDAIIFATGGQRGAEILPLLDWAKLTRAKPKIVIGFSDASLFVNAIAARLGWITVFGPTVQTLGKIEDTGFALLEGATPSYSLSYAGPLVAGPVIASTLTLLPLLLDTPDIPDLEGAILCIEDCNEELTTIDRLMILLKRRGVFEKIAALVCGDFINMTDTGRPFGFTLKDIMLHHAGPIPVAFDAPFGHGDRLKALPIGIVATLSNNALTLKEAAFI